MKLGANYNRWYSVPPTIFEDGQRFIMKNIYSDYI